MIPSVEAALRVEPTVLGHRGSGPTVVGLLTSALGAVGVGLGLAGVLGPPRSVQIGWLIPLIGVELQLDPLGGFFMALTGTVALAVGVYSIGYARRAHLGGFALPVLPVFVTAMLLVPAAASVSTFLLAWELMAIASLIGSPNCRRFPRAFARRCSC
jgi:formate hydrogenlyase subunit 3/multisubunit Na+/H+ antiporter MnhD subunit